MECDQLKQRPIPTVEDIAVGDFPTNILRWIWSSPGMNDEWPWVAIFQLEDDEHGPRFAYYKASCDYTGFDCQGGMDISIARDIPTLIQYCLSEEEYQEYEGHTEPADAW